MTNKTKKLNHSLLCLLQTIALFKMVDKSKYNVFGISDVLVNALFINRFEISPVELRKFIDDLVTNGFNPFSSQLSDVAKIQMKSIIARCDSIINHGKTNKK